MPLNVKVFDAHCDTLLSKDIHTGKSQLRKDDVLKYKNYIQVFSICAETNYAYTKTIHFIKRFERIARDWNMEVIKDAAALNSAKYGAILALEGADAIHDNLSAIDLFYKKGVRLITLTWNNGNSVSSSIADDSDRGLTPFGKEFVKKCVKKHIAVDLSHISDKGFYDVCNITDAPLICSHSNSRTVNKAAKRNITDDQFKELIRRGGVTGINFYPLFLGGSADINAVIKHTEHFCSLGGEKNIGMGSDFDGISQMPTGCEGAMFFYNIANELLRLGYGESTVNGILYGNMHGFFNRVFYGG